MALISDEGPVPTGVLRRNGDKSTPNTQLVVTTPISASRRLLFVTVAYSEVVTKDVIVALDSGIDEAYDCVLHTIGISGSKYGVWIPEGDIQFLACDALVVTALAGGAGVTCAVAIFTVAQ